MNDFQNQITELRRQQDAVAGRIKAALLAGGDTGPIRAEAGRLSRDIAAVEHRAAHDRAKREATSHSAISSAAAVIARDAENAVTSKLAALQPPAHP